MAPTILFIASKIEEEPIKLRHVVNCCLEKFEGATKDKLWMPVTEHPVGIASRSAAHVAASAIA